MDLVKPGKYLARVVSYGIPEPKPGKMPSVVLTFEFEEDGKKRQLTWFGSLSEKAIEHTAKSLIIAGMKSDMLSTLCEPGAFHEKDVSITVEHDTYEGKTRSRVKWINEPGSAQFKSLRPEVVNSQFGNLTGYMKATRKEMGYDGKHQAQADDTGFAPPGSGHPPQDEEFSL